MVVAAVMMATMMAESTPSSSGEAPFGTIPLAPIALACFGGSSVPLILSRRGACNFYYLRWEEVQKKKKKKTNR